MKVADLIKNSGSTGFSFEILPPLKGSSIEKSFKAIDTLREFAPLYINITTHRSELVYKDTPDGLFRRVSERSRPGTVAVAAAIKNKRNLPIFKNAAPSFTQQAFQPDHSQLKGFIKTGAQFLLYDPVSVGKGGICFHNLDDNFVRHIFAVHFLFGHDDQL